MQTCCGIGAGTVFAINGPRLISARHDVIATNEKLTCNCFKSLPVCPTCMLPEIVAMRSSIVAMMVDCWCDKRTGTILGGGKYALFLPPAHLLVFTLAVSGHFGTSRRKLGRSSLGLMSPGTVRPAL